MSKPHLSDLSGKYYPLSKKDCNQLLTLDAYYLMESALKTLTEFVPPADAKLFANFRTYITTLESLHRKVEHPDRILLNDGEVFVLAIDTPEALATTLKAANRILQAPSPASLPEGDIDSAKEGAQELLDAVLIPKNAIELKLNDPKIRAEYEQLLAVNEQFGPSSFDGETQRNKNIVQTTTLQICELLGLNPDAPMPLIILPSDKTMQRFNSLIEEAGLDKELATTHKLAPDIDKLLKLKKLNARFEGLYQPTPSIQLN